MGYSLLTHESFGSLLRRGRSSNSIMLSTPPLLASNQCACFFMAFPAINNGWPWGVTSSSHSHAHVIGKCLSIACTFQWISHHAHWPPLIPSINNQITPWSKYLLPTFCLHGFGKMALQTPVQHFGPFGIPCFNFPVPENANLATKNIIWLYIFSLPHTLALYIVSPIKTCSIVQPQQGLVTWYGMGLDIDLSMPFTMIRGVYENRMYCFNIL